MNTGSGEYLRRDEVVLPDGVELHLDFKEPAACDDTTPIVLIFHGIGGNSDGRLVRKLSDAARDAGWRAAVYNRRGHGDSSLLPAGLKPQQQETTITATATATATASSGTRAPSPLFSAQPAPAFLEGSDTLSEAVRVRLSTGRVQADADADAVGRRRVQMTGSIGRTGSGGAGGAAGCDGAARIAVLHRSSKPQSTGNSSGGNATGDKSSSSSNGGSGVPNGHPAANKNSNTSNNFNASVDSPGPSDDDELRGERDKQPLLQPGQLQRPAPVPAAGLASPTGGATVSLTCERTVTLRRVTKLWPMHSDVEDAHVIVQHLQQRYPRAPKIGLGFSEGSNVLVHYLGVHAADCPFDAAISASNAYDLCHGTRMLDKDWVVNGVIMRPMRRLLVKELPALRELCAARGLAVDFAALRAASSVREFDSLLLVPAYGYADVDAYYREQSSAQWLEAVRTPLLCLNNTDDPIIHPDLPGLAAQAARTNPAVISAITQRGGHLGWLQGWRGESWLAKVMVEYVEAVLEAKAIGILQEPAPAAAPAGAAAGVPAAAAAPAPAATTSKAALAGAGAPAFEGPAPLVAEAAAAPLERAAAGARSAALQLQPAAASPDALAAPATLLATAYYAPTS